MDWNKRLILASSSPRRRDLLSSVGFEFSVVNPKVNEQPKQGESARDYVQRNSFEKGSWVFDYLQKNNLLPGDFTIVSADTVVSVDDKILEKPNDTAHHLKMLEALSGQTHSVFTGFRILDGPSGASVSEVVETKVTMRKLSAQQIQAYASTKEGIGKAGGYAIQGRGAGLVTGIVGSYSNVVGLPLAQVQELLETKFGFGG